MQNIFVFIFFLTANYLTIAQGTTEPVKPNNPVQNYAETMMEKDALQSAAFSFYAKDMSTGKIVADYNGQMSIPSASTMKLVTTATATQYLGRGYRYKTQLMYSGEIDSISGVLNGDLYIIGGGDPTLGSKYYNKEGHARDFLYEWADSIKSFGIIGINGRVIADASKYSYNGVPSGWVWGDLGNYYGAGPSGLTIFDNMCRLEFKTGAAKGDSTEIICIEPFVPGLNISNSVVSADSRKDNAYVYGAPYSLDWFVQGSLPKDRESFIVKASIPDPEYIMALEFNQALAETGIPTKDRPTTIRELNKNTPFVKPELKSIHTHSSPTAASIMNYVNRNSVNLFAEHILCEISYKKSGYGSTNNGALFCMNYWRSKVGGGLFMTDGSGLSRSNAVSAQFLTKLLTYMHKSKSSSKFRESLALAGKRGTMAGMCKGTAAQGRVYGKSGTMTRCKSYAGYVDTKTGKKLAYAMIINNHTCSNSQVRKYFEFLMVKMANY